jgi:hypothetical protein
VFVLVAQWGFDDCDKVEVSSEATRAIGFFGVSVAKWSKFQGCKSIDIDISLVLRFMFATAAGGMDETSKSSFGWNFIKVSQSVEGRI